MRLITLQCPKCHAKLEINAELSHAICNFCGYHFLVDDETKRVDVRLSNPRGLDRDLERGRRSVGENRELAQEVLELIQPISELSASTSQLDTLPKEISKHNNAILASRAIAVSLFGAGVFIGIVSGITEGRFILSFIGGILAGVLMSGIPFFIWMKNLSEMKTKERQLEFSKKKRIDALEALKGKDVNIIPPDYRSRQAMMFIYNALLNQRAVTMQEAVNLYEQELHNNRMETLQRINAQANLINAELNAVRLKTGL